MIGPLLRLASGLAVRPLTVARHGSELAVELVRIGAAGPDRTRRALAATVAATERLLDDAGLADDDRDRLWPLVEGVSSIVDSGVGRAADRTRDGMTALLDGRARDGVTALLDGRGAPRAWRPDPDRNGSGPRPTALLPPGAVLGVDAAATAGAVVLRDPAFELIQYLPRTPTVRTTPLLVVPPPGGAFLAADLAPGHSFVERMVATGQQVLLVSWGRRSDPVRVLRTALDACESITRSPVTALLGFGTGAAAAAGLATVVPGRVATLTLVADGVETPPPPAGPAYVVERDLLDEGWWSEHAAWLHLRTGGDVEAPAELGGRGLRPLVPAPGTLARLPGSQSPDRSWS